MSHDIVKDVGLETYYCKKCSAHTEDLLSKLCKSALHEEHLKMAIESKKIETNSQIENRKLSIFLFGIILGIIVFLGFFIIIFTGFENITAAIQNLIVISSQHMKNAQRGAG